MDVQVIMLGGLASTMLLFGVALAIAWARFGRTVHVALWSAAFFCSSASYVAIVGRQLWPSIFVPATIVAGCLTLACSGLLSQGFRSRSGWNGWRAIAAATIAAMASASIVALAWPAMGYHRVVVNIFSAVMFAFAAHAVRMGADDRRGAARAALWMLSCFSAFVAALSVLAVLVRPGGPLPEAAYRVPFLLGVPTGLAGLGLFTMLLIASDLADRLQRLASLDPLTGVLNRRGVDFAAARLLAICRRGALPFTVVLADLDRFKAINDRFGHAFGDVVLQRFARHCEAMIREGDIVGRLGGEEFVIALADAGPRAATEAMDRLRAGLADVLADLALPTPITASFGIATLGDRTDTLAAMLVRADRALYGSKDDGRDRITVAPIDPPATDPRFLAAWSRAEPAADTREAATL